jgi:ankyrin repeat protein
VLLHRHWIRLLAAAGSAVACTPPARIDLAVVNTGERYLDRVDVSCTDCRYPAPVGVLPPLSAKTSLSILTEMPAQVEVMMVEGETSRSFVLTVPASRNHKVDRTLAVVIPTSGEPVAKVTEGSWFTSTVLPDSADPQFRLYRALAGAAYHRDRTAVDTLLRAGAPLFWDDPEIQSPIEWAALAGDSEVLASLLSHAKHSPHHRLLHAVKLAAQDDHISCLRLLRRRVPFDPPEMQDALYAAVSHGNGRAVRYFVEEVKIPVSTPVTMAGHTMLAIAITNNNRALIEYLRSKGG